MIKSVCCNANIIRGTKLAGYQTYCSKCDKKCEIKVLTDSDRDDILKVQG